MNLTITNIKRFGRTERESVTIEDGKIRGWNLPEEGHGETIDGRGGTVDRAIEFFMPVGQSGESQQWITSSMRLLSLAARGGFLERALSDMRKVAWDRGAVRLGTHRKDDGTQVPLWHESEVAAMAYAIQNILARRAEQPMQQQVLPLDEPPLPSGMPPAMAGKKCTECGAHAVIRKDGCDYCTQCGHLGSCA